MTLFHLEGLSHSKVAEALGVPVSAARSLVTGGRQKLQPMLASYAAEVLPAHLGRVATLAAVEFAIRPHTPPNIEPDKCPDAANDLCGDVKKGSRCLHYSRVFGWDTLVLTIRR